MSLAGTPRLSAKAQEENRGPPSPGTPQRNPHQPPVARGQRTPASSRYGAEVLFRCRKDGNKSRHLPRKSRPDDFPCLGKLDDEHLTRISKLRSSNRVWGCGEGDEAVFEVRVCFSRHSGGQVRVPGADYEERDCFPQQEVPASAQKVFHLFRLLWE